MLHRIYKFFKYNFKFFAIQKQPKYNHNNNYNNRSILDLNVKSENYSQEDIEMLTEEIYKLKTELADLISYAAYNESVCKAYKKAAKQLKNNYNDLKNTAS